MATKSTKIKLGQINQLQKELNSLLSEKISFASKWEVKTMLDSLKSHAENLGQTVSDIYKKYGEEVEEGSFKIKEENIEKANKDLAELTNKEISIKGKLSLEALSKIESDVHYSEIFSFVEK